MGIGDEILASGQAKVLHERNGLPVVILDRFGRPRTHEIWLGNPRITSNPAGAQRLVNGGGARPYIAAKTSTRWTWKKWDIRPGEIYLTDAERDFAKPYAGRIMIEPHTKVVDGNKAWLWERWQDVVHRFPHHFVQVGPGSVRWLNKVDRVNTTFRQACAVLAVSRAFIGPEGALHHAAAALGVPAVVVWSHFIAPEFTGYVTQRNIRHADGWCGSRLPCSRCRKAMDAITVDEVLNNLTEILN